jgi:hypothetical protein
VVPSAFARDLERDLLAANKNLEIKNAVLSQMRGAFRDFDAAREANQWPNTGQSWSKDAEILIDRIRLFLPNVQAQR